MGRLLSLLLLVAFATQLVSCADDYTAMAEQRLEFARKQRGNIEVAAIKHSSDPSYLRGILLAAKEINQRPGKLIGRPVHVNVLQESDTVAESMPVIRRIVANPKTVAVMGHRQSKIAIPASAIYERSEVIFFPSFATADALTGHRFKYTFRMMPNTKILASQQASIAGILGYKKLVILHARKSVSRELAFLFEDAAIEQGIKIIKRASFFSGQNKNYRPIISQFNNEPFDAIYIAAGTEASAHMVRQLREMGLSQPIIGSDAMARAAYNENVGVAAANHTIVPSIYQMDIASQANKNFIRKYQNEYDGDLPNQRAAQGYDSMHLLARAISHAKTTLTSTLSPTLRYMPAWAGITGIHAFDQDGELRGKKYFFKVWKDGKLVDLPVIHHFYLLDRFAQNLKQQYGDEYSVTRFSDVFRHRMHEDDHKAYLLDLAHELVRFKRIGIIYENTEAGRAKSHYDALKILAKRKKDKGVKLVECRIPFSLLEPKEAEQHLLGCYGRLSLGIDALLTPDYYQNPNNPNMIEQLDSALDYYKIPSISIASRGGIDDSSIRLTKRTDIKPNSKQLEIYKDLLKGIKLHQFYEQLVGLPEVSVNLVKLQKSALSDQPLLDISTDIYLDSTSLMDEFR